MLGSLGGEPEPATLRIELERCGIDGRQHRFGSVSSIVSMKEHPGVRDDELSWRGNIRTWKDVVLQESSGPHSITAPQFNVMPTVIGREEEPVCSNSERTCEGGRESAARRWVDVVDQDRAGHGPITVPEVSP